MVLVWRIPGYSPNFSAIWYINIMSDNFILGKKSRFVSSMMKNMRKMKNSMYFWESQ